VVRQILHALGWMTSGRSVDGRAVKSKSSSVLWAAKAAERIRWRALESAREHLGFAEHLEKLRIGRLLALFHGGSGSDSGLLRPGLLRFSGGNCVGR
jgi:hypothetical protein